MIPTVEQSILWDLHTAIVYITVVVGAVIVWKAIRAYRQNGDRGMLFFAVGLFLLVVVPPAVNSGYELLIGPIAVQHVAIMSLIGNLFQLAGALAILTSIYVRA